MYLISDTTISLEGQSHVPHDIISPTQEVSKNNVKMEDDKKYKWSRYLLVSSLMQSSC